MGEGCDVVGGGDVGVGIVFFEKGYYGGLIVECCEDEGCGVGVGGGVFKGGVVIEE